MASEGKKKAEDISEEAYENDESKENYYEQVGGGEIYYNDDQAPASDINKKKEITDVKKEEGEDVSPGDIKLDVPDVSGELQVPKRKEKDKNTNKKDRNTSNVEDKLQNTKDDLDVHFSDPFTMMCELPCCPVDKSNSKRTDYFTKIPWKFLIIMIKLIFCTFQLVVFANDRMKFATFLDRNNVAMRHLLLRNWDVSYETLPYPPSQGVYALYRIEDLMEHINFTVNTINEIPTLAVGSFFIPGNESSTPVEICLKYFESGTYDRDTQKLKIKSTTKTQCNKVSAEGNETDYGFDPSIKDLLQSTEGRLVRLLEIALKFTMVSVHVQITDDKHYSDCFKIKGEIKYDNTDVNGQVLVTLNTDIKSFQCLEDTQQSSRASQLDDFLAGVVIFVSVCSIMASFVTFLCSIKLCKRAVAAIEEPLSFREKFQIVKTRDIVILIGDILNIAGTGIKILLDRRGIDSSDFDYDACAITLGLGCFIVWLTVLHYFSYDRTFNVSV